MHQRFGADFDALSGDEIQALVTAHTEGAVTNQQLQGMLAMHRADITRMLGGLVTRGFLVSDGIGRGTRYSLAGAALPEGTPPLGRGTPP